MRIKTSIRKMGRLVFSSRTSYQTFQNNVSFGQSSAGLSLGHHVERARCQTNRNVNFRQNEGRFHFLNKIPEFAGFVLCYLFRIYK